MREIRISELSISRIAVRGRYYITCLFFPREIRTYSKWFLHSNKRWLSERFSLLSRYELLLLEHILFCFNIFIFLYNYQFYSHLIIIVKIIFVIIVFIIVITTIISSFSMVLASILLVFTILFYLCIYQMFLDFKQMTWPYIVQSWQ